MGWLWAYGPVRRAFDKADVDAIAVDLVARLRRHGYAIVDATEGRCDDGR
jgi:hypothetical protein